MPVIGNYVGEVGRLKQYVGVHYIGEVARISQEVDLAQNYVGEVGRLRQSVTSSTVDEICRFTQYVRNQIGSTAQSPFGNNTFFNRNGWDLQIRIGNIEITPDMIYDMVEVHKIEDGNNTGNFSVFVPNPVDFINNIYDGNKNIKIDYYDGSNVRRLFTGFVDSPEIDLINKTVKINCSNNRDELVKDKLAGVVKSIGYYSQPILGEFNSTKEELDLRLRTIPMSLSFDSYNNYSFDTWAVGSADFTFNAVDIYYRQPNIVWQNRADIINKVNITLDRQRTRLYYLERTFGWTAPYYGDITNYAANLYSSPTIGMIETAINNAKYKLITGPTYTSVYPLTFTWFGVPYAQNIVVKYDTSGNIVKDAKGDILYTDITEAIFQTFNVMQASWTAAIQFSQYIQDSFALTVSSSGSITQYKTLSSDDNYNYEDQYDASAWEDSQHISPEPPGSIENGNNYYYDIPELDSGRLYNAILTALNIAKTKILSTHRGTQVNFETPIKPTLELKHTVSLNTNLISCVGRTVEIQHKLNVIDGEASTAVTLALSRCPIASTSDNLIPPSQGTYTPTYPSDTIILGNTYGKVPADYLPDSDSWNGFIGNKAKFGSYVDSLGNTYTFTYITEFTDEFRVDTPDVSTNLRNIQTVSVSSSYDLNIPNDTLTIDLS